MYSCDVCSRIFKEKRNLTSHTLIHEREKNHSCSVCSKTFLRKTNSQRHEKNCKGVSKQPIRGRKQSAVGAGITGETIVKQTSFKIVKTATAFSQATVTWKLSYKKNNGVDYNDLVKRSVEAMKEKILKYRNVRKALKFNMSLHIHFEKAVDSSIITDPPVVLVTEQMEVYMETDIDELLLISTTELVNRIETYEMAGSGWIVSNLSSLDTTVWQLDPIRASTFHPLPTWIQAKTAVKNIKNRDNRCFKWAVLAGLYTPTDPKSPGRVSSYTACEYYKDAPDFTTLTYPVALKDISKFEKRNNISINVYSIDEKTKNIEIANEDNEVKN